MGKIIATEEVKQRVQKAAAGDKSVYINWEAVSELPDEFDVQISKIEFKIDTDFSKVNESPLLYMPTPALHYQIAEAKGISGMGNPVSEPIYQQVNINEMEMISPAINFVNIMVGYKVTKQSGVMTEDGTVRLSSPCTSEFNVWTRCLELWSKEEMYTEGYTKSGKYPNKYDTKYKRKAHFYSEMKFAAAKAETKAFEKTIRELAGLMTGYKTEDLKEGAWYFARVRRSKEMLQLEASARLMNIQNGGNPGKHPTELLFGPSEAEPEPVNVTPEPQESQIDTVSRVMGEPDTSIMSRALKYYLETKETAEAIDEKLFPRITKLVSWLDTGPNLTTKNNQKWFDDALEILKNIEKDVPEFFRYEHKLY